MIKKQELGGSMQAVAVQHDREKYVFIWPAFIIVLVVSIFPLVYALTVSFQSVRLVPPLPPRFVGVDNYAEILSSARFWGSTWTTATIVFVSVAFQYVIGFALALALHHNVRGSSLYRVVFLLPMFIAPVCVALIARMVFHPYLGPVNDAMNLFGFVNIPFLTEAPLAIMVLISIEVWQWTPFVTLLMLAGLQGLPNEVFEAARVDNVSAWRRFRDLTFPMLLPLSVAVIFIRLVEGFKVIDTVFVLTGGGPGTATETLTLFAYNEGFKKFNLGMTSALSFVFLIVVILFGTAYLIVARRLMARYE
ncbi:MAG: sugar ABC transporter permease [Pseudomonadota bacterium]